MKRLALLLVALGAVVCGAAAATAQSFDLGGLGLGVLGGRPGLGIGSASTETSAATPSGTAFGARTASPLEGTDIAGEAAQGLTGSDILSAPPRFVPGEVQADTAGK